MKSNNIILIILILMVTQTFAQVSLKHLIGSINYPNSLSSCEVYISTAELKSNKAIISFVLTAAKPFSSTITNRIAEGWVNLVVAEDAEVDYDNIKYFGGTSTNSQANSLFDPNYKLDKLASEIVGNFLSFTILGDLVNSADATQNINDYLFKTKHEVPDFDFNQFDQVDLPFNAPNKYSKIQIDIPVLFGNNKVIGTGAYWEVLGFNKSGQGFRTGENAGVYFEKFNIEEKLDANSVSKTNLNSDFSGKSGTFVDERDGRVYKWVKIGEQIWMAENLKFKTLSESWTYNDDENYVKTYGRLYNWATACKQCPNGWHLSSDAEWTALENYLISNGNNFNGTTTTEIAKLLAGTTNWNASSKFAFAIGNRVSINNKSGFSALPGGFSDLNGTFYEIGSSGYWWSSTEMHANHAWTRIMFYDSPSVHRISEGKLSGFSVRCVRD